MSACPATTAKSCAIFGLESPLNAQACELFLSYLAGCPTTSLAARYSVPITRINRSIKRTVRELLHSTGSAYERQQRLAHLSRLRNEASLWVFRLAVVVPPDVAFNVASTLADSRQAEPAAQSYAHLHALFMEHLQRWVTSCRREHEASVRASSPQASLCGKSRELWA